MYPYQLPQLPYSYDALEPHIDETTMRLHHTKHHQAYVDKLNQALEKYPQLQKQPLEELLKNITALPREIRQAVINYGGGHYNHSLFWQVMSPQGGGQPRGRLAETLYNPSRGPAPNFEEFQERFTREALSIFGSGWVWLVVVKGTREGYGLTVTSTPNQDSPLMQGYTPILGLDVWEHAYYLKYQNRRADYIAAWWNVVNWKEVSRRFENA
jgi:Fe-Mn family superoxide dismutase